MIRNARLSLGGSTNSTVFHWLILKFRVLLVHGSRVFWTLEIVTICLSKIIRNCTLEIEIFSLKILLYIIKTDVSLKDNTHDLCGISDTLIWYPSVTPKKSDYRSPRIKFNLTKLKSVCSENWLDSSNSW